MDSDVQHSVNSFWSNLPVVSKDQIPQDDTACAVCLVDWDTLYDADPACVTKLPCAHVFCRPDLADWIRTLHGSCPTCRASFLDIRPPSSDDESDGGEYIPPPDDDEEDDSFVFTSDGFTDAESNGDAMDTDGDWERSSTWSEEPSLETDDIDVSTLMTTENISSDSLNDADDQEPK